MPAASHTETAFSDDVLVVCQRFKSGPSSFDWTIQITTRVLDASGNEIPSANLVRADASGLENAGQITSFKAHLNAMVSQAATNKSIATNL